MLTARYAYIYDTFAGIALLMPLADPLDPDITHQVIEEAASFNNLIWQLIAENAPTSEFDSLFDLVVIGDYDL